MSKSSWNELSRLNGKHSGLPLGISCPATTLSGGLKVAFTDLRLEPTDAPLERIHELMGGGGWV